MDLIVGPAATGAVLEIWLAIRTPQRVMEVCTTTRPTGMLTSLPTLTKRVTKTLVDTTVMAESVTMPMDMALRIQMATDTPTALSNQSSRSVDAIQRRIFFVGDQPLTVDQFLFNTFIYVIATSPHNP